MKWVLLFEIVYVVIILLVIFRVLLDTRSGVKALAYILFITLNPQRLFDPIIFDRFSL